MTTNLPAANQKYTSIKALVEKNESEFAKALPKHLTPERLTRIALTEFRKTPKLLECTPESIMGSLLQCAQLGLEPGNSQGMAYLIPYDNKKQGVTECQFQIGYRGLIALVLRSDKIVDISAEAVYENDVFDIQHGTQKYLIHKPSLKDRGEFMGVYAIAELKDGSPKFTFMNKADVDRIKSKSKTSSFGPWVDHYIEMAKKTVIRNISKYLPTSSEAQAAITLDESEERGEQKNASILDVTPNSVPEDLNKKLGLESPSEPEPQNHAWEKEYDEAGPRG